MQAEWQPNQWPGKRVLCLGCGRRPVTGASNLDLVQVGEWVDIVVDLDALPWEWGVLHQYDVIVAFDVVEHLVDPLAFVNECHRLLSPGGALVMRGAAWDNPASYIDPTHRHRFHEDTFDFFDRTTRLGDHYGRFYVDSLGRSLTEWRVESRDRVNADPRWLDAPDIQWRLRKL